MIFIEKPDDFVKENDVVACYIKVGKKFILLQRQPHKAHGTKWGLPAGKVGRREGKEEAMLREITEETGIMIAREALKYLQSLWVRNEGHDIHYHTFSSDLATLPQVLLSIDEHKDYKWVTPAESLEMDLVHDLDECNKLFFKL